MLIARVGSEFCGGSIAGATLDRDLVVFIGREQEAHVKAPLLKPVGTLCRHEWLCHIAKHVDAAHQCAGKTVARRDLVAVHSIFRLAGIIECGNGKACGHIALAPDAAAPSASDPAYRIRCWAEC